MTTTKLSSKGQVIIPKEVRDAKGWQEGDELLVENRPEGVLLRRRSPFKPTTLDEVVGCVKRYYSGPPKTIEEMDEGLKQHIRNKWRKDNP